MNNTEVDIFSLWYSFTSDNSSLTKNKLILHYIWLVKYVLQSMNLPSNSILNDDDFVNIGILGLNEAIERFEVNRGVKFESYAIPRIKGTIQDELRRLDWLSRTARKKAHEFIQAGDELRSSEGREVSTEEIRQKLNVSHDEYNSYLTAAAAAKASFAMSEYSQASADEDDKDFLDEIPDPDDDNTLVRMENEERLSFITEFLQKLTERKRLVMSLYYYESMTFKEIGQLISVSESRVCQIHTQVVGDLRVKLKEFDYV